MSKDKLRRIAIVGPESTGKTSLSRELAAHYGCHWAPEYARSYLNALGRPYVREDLISIAEGQLRMEELAAIGARRFLFCDTNLLVIRIWSQVRYGSIAPEIEAIWQPKEYVLHLLTAPDLDWEPDPQREHPDLLEELFAIYLDELRASAIPYAVLRGHGAERLKSAISAMESLEP